MLEMPRFQKEKKDVGSLQNTVTSLKEVINIKTRSFLCYNINYKKKNIEVKKNEDIKAFFSLHTNQNINRRGEGGFAATADGYGSRTII